LKLWNSKKKYNYKEEWIDFREIPHHGIYSNCNIYLIYIKIVEINYGKINDYEINSVDSYLIYDYNWFNIIYSELYKYFKDQTSTSFISLSE
jgi:hypothetical protein